MIDPLGLATSGFYGYTGRGKPYEIAVAGQNWLQLDVSDEVFSLLSEVSLSVYASQVGVVTVGEKRYVSISDIVAVVAQVNKILETRGHTTRLCVTQGKLHEVETGAGVFFQNSEVGGKITETDE